MHKRGCDLLSPLAHRAAAAGRGTSEGGVLARRQTHGAHCGRAQAQLHAGCAYLRGARRRPAGRGAARARTACWPAGAPPAQTWAPSRQTRRRARPPPHRRRRSSSPVAGRHRGQRAWLAPRQQLQRTQTPVTTMSIKCRCSGLQPPCQQQRRLHASRSAPGNRPESQSETVIVAGGACLLVQHSPLWLLSCTPADCRGVAALG